MTDLIVAFLRDVNIAQLIATGVMVWFFYARLDLKIEKLDSKMEKGNQALKEMIEKGDRELKEMIEKGDRGLKEMMEKGDRELKEMVERGDKDLKESIHELGEKVEDIDRRLWRIEGSLATHGYFTFRHNPHEKVEGA